MLYDFSDIWSPQFTSQNLIFQHLVLENYVLAQTPNLQFSLARNSPPRFTKTTLRKTMKKQTKSKRPFTSLKIAQAPKP